MTWKVSAEDAQLIAKIAERAQAISREQGFDTRPDTSFRVFMMDLTACHANGTPLDLQGLLDATSADFTHDIFGIRKYMDCTTGKLTDFFCPRYEASRVVKAEN